VKRKSILFTCLTAASVFFALMPIAGCDFGSNTTDTETPDPDDPADLDPEEPVETERIENGDFADGFVLPWSAWNGEGGASTQTVTGGELVVTVTAPGNQPYSVQIFQDGLSIPDGEQTVSFRAKAAEPRMLRVQLGKGLSADPWFVEFMPVKSFDLTTEWQDFSFTFDKSNSTYSDGKLVFELGTMTGEGTLATDVYIDDVSLVNLDSGTPVETPGEFVYPAVNADSWTPGDGWTLSWQDEFNDGAFDTNTWTRQTMLNPPNNEWQQYFGGTSNDNAWEADGYMVLKASMNGTAHGDNQYKSARVISNPGGQDGSSSAEGKTFLYGKIAARIQLPYDKGIWPAFWMLGDNCSETGGDTTWPECGEIDILETGAKDDPAYGQGTTHGTLHHDPTVENITNDWNNLYLPSAEHTLPGGKFFAENFHVFEIEWDESKIVWKLDGAKIGEQSISEAGRSEFHKPFYVLFNIAVGGDFTSTPDSTTHFPQYMYIDWIRHYTK